MDILSTRKISIDLRQFSAQALNYLRYLRRFDGKNFPTTKLSRGLLCAFLCRDVSLFAGRVKTAQGQFQPSKCQQLDRTFPKRPFQGIEVSRDRGRLSI